MVWVVVVGEIASSVCEEVEGSESRLGGAK